MFLRFRLLKLDHMSVLLTLVSTLDSLSGAITLGLELRISPLADPNQSMALRLIVKSTVSTTSNLSYDQTATVYTFRAE